MDPDLQAAYDDLMKRLLVERMSGMPRWHLTNSPRRTKPEEPRALRVVRGAA